MLSTVHSLLRKQFFNDTKNMFFKTLMALNIVHSEDIEIS